MDFLRIDETKLKITLTEEELLFYGMDLSALSYSSTETRRAFWAILDDAKHATGFDAAAAKISVQVYASRTGGCEMYVVSNREEHEKDGLFSGSAVEQIDEESRLTVTPALPRRFGRAMGEFDSLSHLLNACLALSSGGYNADSSAWQDGDRYYLYLSGNRTASAKEEPQLSASGVICEFGKTVKDLSLTYLAEHGICLCPNCAVERLGAMAT